MSEPRPSISELLHKIGTEFVELYKTNRRGAWQSLVEAMILNLDILSSSNERTSALRDIISVAMQVDEKLAGGKDVPKGPVAELGLDSVAGKWTMSDGDRT